MLTVTQLCPSCGRRVAAGRTCSTCAPSVARTLVAGVRALALVGGAVTTAVVLLEVL